MKFLLVCGWLLVILGAFMIDKGLGCGVVGALAVLVFSDY